MNKILDNVNNFIEFILASVEDKSLAAFNSISSFMTRFYAVSIFAFVFLVTLSSFGMYLNG
jgi:hypothetical protein